MVVIGHGSTELLAELGDRVKRSAVNHIGFQRMEERFHVGVLAWRAATRHALADAAGRSPSAHGRPLKLAAAIGVEDQTGIRPPAPEGGVQHGARDARGAGRGESPRQDPA